ncbi:MAG TPA: ECF-type sigma factor [Bryobacteraceae bacterium]|nr:ECF-type sigma factor [Bryobacteraceae bacterium]
MAGAEEEQITGLLIQWANGDRNALDLLTASVYGEMRKIADGYLHQERSGHTLQPTALVNETWLRLAKQAGLSFENRKQFFGLAAQVMRRVLVDYARAARAGKRGAGEQALSMESLEIGIASDLDELLALDQALERLAVLHSRPARVIELRYFAGLNLEEISDLLAISPATVSREQKMAEAWLGRAMESPQP